MNGKRDDMDIRFEQFYAADLPRVRSFARLLTKSEEDAEDIAQNIFLKLWTRPESWEGQKTMTSYPYIVARNEIFNPFKYQRVEQEHEDEILKAQLLGEPRDEDSSLLENLYYKEVLLLTKTTLSQLPDRHRQVSEMSRFERLSHKEIVDKLQIPLRTVEDHIYKTLTEPRRMLTFTILFRIFPQFFFLDSDTYISVLKYDNKYHFMKNYIYDVIDRYIKHDYPEEVNQDFRTRLTGEERTDGKEYELNKLWEATEAVITPGYRDSLEWVYELTGIGSRRRIYPLCTRLMVWRAAVALLITASFISIHLALQNRQASDLL